MSIDAPGFLRHLGHEPFMAILYGYFDESGKQADHQVISFSGVCAPLSKLEDFDNEWKLHLRRCGLQSLHMKYVTDLDLDNGSSMPKGQSADERIEVLKPFADCINKHLELGLMQTWDVKGFQTSLSPEAKKKLGSPTDPYYTAFVRALSEMVDYVQGDDRISLICDDDEQTAWDCFQHYRGARKADPEIRKKTVALTFADDEHFPALQAADMIAFLSRREALRQFYGKPNHVGKLLDYLTTELSSGFGAKWMKMFADESAIKKLSASLQ